MTSAAPAAPGGLLRGPLLLLYACLFVAMIGYGITVTVLPFYTERIHGLAGVSQRVITLHVAILTSVYALGQLIASPFIGRLGDRFGRRPILLVGLAGMAVTQAAFGVTTSLPSLYALRVLSGVATAALLVASTAYVADVTSEADRSRGMAWFGTTVSLGLVAGPVLGGLLNRPGLSFGHGALRLDGYSLPFLFAGLLALVIFAAALPMLPEPSPATTAPTKAAVRAAGGGRPGLRSLLALVAASQLGLALFEGTFILYARVRLATGPGRASVVFIVCGLVMAVFQVWAVGPMARFASPVLQISVGFALTGIGILSLVTTRNFSLVLVFVAVLALGTALITPNLAALVSSRGGPHVGTALGLKSSASSLGQFIGPLAGGLLLGWRSPSPFLLTGALLVAVGVAVGFVYPLATSTPPPRAGREIDS